MGPLRARRRALAAPCLGILLALTPVYARAQRRRAADALPTVVLHRGMVITRSVRVAPRTYRLAASASLDSAVITVRGDDVTVDFAGATVMGTDPAADPDRAAGVAIRIDGGRHVRIVHARLRGYRVGILARGTTDLRLVRVNASYGWKPRLYSLVEHESLVDWLSYHHDEHDEWLRYGAAFYLEDVHGGEVRASRAEQGMNGLMLVRSDHLRVWDDDFSFNSGVGIGLYRACDNTIVHNRVDYDVRGYSHGFYHRGQDSAGILVYEQSARNVIAYNSVTHGGDGLFLWAGQHTMDTGAGGANGNLVYGNDFSFAPTNGMEATFSRNAFIDNRVAGSDYGLWGGYSFGSVVAGNDFVRNRIGIAIEHGQDNRITANRFEGDSTAISVWANAIEPSDWGYPKHRDTRSRDVRVDGNLFVGNRVGVRAANTTALHVVDDRFAGVDSPTVVSDTTDYRFAGNVVVSRAAAGGTPPRPTLPVAFAQLAPRIPGARMPRATALERRDRSAIIVDEWGPYDWRSPRLWPAGSARAVPLALRVLGPPGRWRVVARSGIAALSRTSGRTMDTVLVTPAPDSEGDWSLTLEYRGAATVSPRGVHRVAGVPYRFSYARFEPPIAWTTRIVAWSDTTDPRHHPEAFAALLGGSPLLVRHEPRLDYEWYRPTIAGIPQERFALEAAGTVTLRPGTYTLRTISDDAVRVWVDDSLAVDDWTPHESRVDFAALAGGRHALRVQYYQVDGWTELRVEIVRGSERSPGSPGPH